MDNLTCDTCGQPAIGVASSAMGAISFAYCRECAQRLAEPFIMFEYLYDCVSTDGEGLADWVNKAITFHEGKYMTWPEYLQWRKDNGREKSMPEIPEPEETYHGQPVEDDDFPH